MKELETINEILDFAIQNEQNAVDFYTELASTARNAEMAEIFKQFAREEMGHKTKLIRVREEGVFGQGVEEVQDLRIADYVVRTHVHPDMSYEEALVLAMKREKAAFRLYSKLSEKAPSPDLRNLFLNLAQEESRHKLRFEIEYDEYVLKEN